jgi:hypothetical protein
VSSQSFWSPNYLLSFGGPRNDVLLAMTNENPTTPNKILLNYLQYIEIGSTNAPTSRSTYWMGAGDFYLVKGLLNDPVNSFFAYLFVACGSVASRTFGVFKMDFSTVTPKYVWTALSMSSGSGFTVNTLARISRTDANDFLFAGKAQSLTDGTLTKTFPTATGYVMKGKTTDST